MPAWQTSSGDSKAARHSTLLCMQLAKQDASMAKLICPARPLTRGFGMRQRGFGCTVTFVLLQVADSGSCTDDVSIC